MLLDARLRYFSMKLVFDLVMKSTNSFHFIGRPSKASLLTVVTTIIIACTCSHLLTDSEGRSESRGLHLKIGNFGTSLA